MKYKATIVECTDSTEQMPSKRCSRVAVSKRLPPSGGLLNHKRDGRCIFPHLAAFDAREQNALADPTLGDLDLSMDDTAPSGIDIDTLPHLQDIVLRARHWTRAIEVALLPLFGREGFLQPLERGGHTGDPSGAWLWWWGEGNIAEGGLSGERTLVWAFLGLSGGVLVLGWEDVDAGFRRISIRTGSGVFVRDGGCCGTGGGGRRRRSARRVRIFESVFAARTTAAVTLRVCQGTIAAIGIRCHLLA
jgi:hypothetical protein